MFAGKNDSEIIAGVKWPFEHMAGVKRMVGVTTTPVGYCISIAMKIRK